MPEDKTSQNRMSAVQKKAEALRLRASGMKLEDIKKRVGYRSVSGVHKAIVTGLQETLQEPADELRKMEVERLDRMLEGIWEKATKGGTWQIDRVLSIMERRARLLGLDKPPSEGSDIAAKAQFYLDLVNSARAQAKDLSEK
jgi:hypothetical protein